MLGLYTRSVRLVYIVMFTTCFRLDFYTEYRNYTRVKGNLGFLYQSLLINIECINLCLCVCVIDLYVFVTITVSAIYCVSIDIKIRIKDLKVV